MPILERLNRRDFIIGATFVSTAIALKPSLVLGQTYEPRESPWYADPKNFWETVEPKINKILEAASLNFTPDEYHDLQIYTPFYLAGEIKYEVPWLLLWIIHQEETTTSRDKNPLRSGYYGAMQRDRSLWPDRDVDRAISDLTFLKSLPQRYHDDHREIVWASSFIRAHTNRIQAKYPNQSDEQCILDSLYSYCAPVHAQSRINKFRARKPLFDL